MKERQPLPTLPASLGQKLARPLAAAILLAVAALAAGVESLAFKPGLRFLQPAEEKVTAPPTAAPNLEWDWFLIAITVAFIVLGTFSVIYVLLSPEHRKPFLRYTTRLFLLVTAFGLLATFYTPPVEGEETLPPGTPAPATELHFADSASTAPTEMLPEAPPARPWAVFGVTLVVMLVFGGAGYWLWLRLRPPINPYTQITRSALRQLSEGRSWEDTVIQCYASLSQALSQQRGLARPAAYTPTEFIALLEQAGLPGAPLRELTRLFEQARYSARHSDPTQAQKASDALAVVLSALGSEITPEETA